MKRMPPIPLDAMSGAQREVYDRIVSGPRGHIGGPHWSWLRSPPLAEAAQAYGRYCRFETQVPPRLIEIAILVTAVHWRARLEWDLHVPVATRLGLPAEAIEAIRLGRDPGFADPAERAAHAFCRELLGDRRVAAATYDALLAALGEPAAAELVGILGYYALVSMTIVAFEVPTTGEGPDPFPAPGA
ncbi:MAG TPA: carboxymuconolactone decarboxylase family protein [Allosphingosinicella sp.]|nr:carboxymuconolactone decarboxylase family protein [Allosphingosinicella sp.]